MCELKTHSIAPDPAHCAFNGAMISEIKVYAVPQLQPLRRAGDHCPAAGQIDQLSLMVEALVGEADRFANKAVTVGGAAV